MLGWGMTFMLLFSLFLSVSISESVSQPNKQICPNCKMVGREVQRYRRIKERFWQKSTNNNDERILEKISEQDLLEKETSKNVLQYFWQKQNISPDRSSIFLIYSLAYGFYLTYKLSYWMSIFLCRLFNN